MNTATDRLDITQNCLNKRRITIMSHWTKLNQSRKWYYNAIIYIKTVCGRLKFRLAHKLSLSPSCSALTETKCVDVYLWLFFSMHRSSIQKSFCSIYCLCMYICHQLCTPIFASESLCIALLLVSLWLTVLWCGFVSIPFCEHRFLICELRWNLNHVVKLTSC